MGRESSGRGKDRSDSRGRAAGRRYHERRIGANERIPLISSRIFTSLATDAATSAGWARESGSVVAESVGVRDMSEASGMADRPCTDLAVAPKQAMLNMNDYA
jgi:hypothetical protein